MLGKSPYPVGVCQKVLLSALPCTTTCKTLASELSKKGGALTSKSSDSLLVLDQSVALISSKGSGEIRAVLLLSLGVGSMITDERPLRKPILNN